MKIEPLPAISIQQKPRQRCRGNKKPRQRCRGIKVSEISVNADNGSCGLTNPSFFKES